MKRAEKDELALEARVKPEEEQLLLLLVDKTGLQNDLNRDSIALMTNLDLKKMNRPISTISLTCQSIRKPKGLLIKTTPDNKEVII